MLKIQRLSSDYLMLLTLSQTVAYQVCSLSRCDIINECYFCFALSLSLTHSRLKVSLCLGLPLGFSTQPLTLQTRLCLCISDFLYVILASHSCL